MKWEYKVEIMKLMTIAAATDLLGMGGIGLNDIGEDGWEAVSWWHSETNRLDDKGNDTVVLFKRPISK